MSADQEQHPQDSETEVEAETDQQMFQQLLQLAEKLLVANEDLFKTAVAHLTSLLPPKADSAPRSAGAEEKGRAQRERHKRMSYCKYKLPNGLSLQEYYECTICGERRVANTFYADHQHASQRPSVRWYCPQCKELFAVTHRGYHIRKRHPDPDQQQHQQQQQHNAKAVGTSKDDDGHSSASGSASSGRRPARKRAREAFERNEPPPHKEPKPASVADGDEVQGGVDDPGMVGEYDGPGEYALAAAAAAHVPVVDEVGGEDCGPAQDDEASVAIAAMTRMTSRQNSATDPLLLSAQVSAQMSELTKLCKQEGAGSTESFSVTPSFVQLGADNPPPPDDGSTTGFLFPPSFSAVITRPP